MALMLIVLSLKLEDTNYAFNTNFQMRTLSKLNGPKTFMLLVTENATNLANNALSSTEAHYHCQ